MTSRTFQPTPAFRKKEEHLRQSTSAEIKKKLQNDVKNLFKDPQHCDLLLVSQSKELAVHSFILEARFPEFYKYCQAKQASNKVTITELSFDELERCIETLYSKNSIDCSSTGKALALREETSPTMPDTENHSLYTDLLSLFDKHGTEDVGFSVEGKVIRGHKAILAARCEYFAAMFSSCWKEASLSSISVPDVSHEFFLAILKFIYGASEDVLSFPASKVLRFADMYGMQDLVGLVVVDLKITRCHLFHKPCTYCIPQVYDCLKLCESFYQTENLQSQCIQWISKNFQKTLACRQLSQMSERFQKEVQREIHKQMSPSTAAVMWLKFNTMTASLKNLNTSWTHGVLKFVGELHELCLKETAENFPQFCELSTIAAFLKDTNHSNSMLEQLLNEILERLTVSNCCCVLRGFQKIVDRVRAMDVTESHFCSPFDSDLESFEVLQKCLKRCEKFIIGRIGPVSQTSAWQDISPAKQQELKSSAFFVDL